MYNFFRSKINYAIFLIACVITMSLNAQISPGGIGTTNITGWFRADDLSSGDVSSWSTTFPSGASTITVSDNQAPYPQLVTTPTGAVSNYNRTLEFTGNSYAGLNSTNLKGLSNTSALNLLDNAYTNNQGSFFSAYYLPTPPASNGHMLLYNEGSDAIQLRNLNNSGRIALGLLSTNSTNASRDWSEDFRPNITSYTGNRTSSTSMKGYNKGGLLPTPTVASQSSGINSLYIGYSPTIASSAYNGYLHEFIFYNRDLTSLEMAKIHTYLSVKYGVTLSNNGGGSTGDYIATNDVTIWDADNQSVYHNDVIAIGRDDVEGLYQRQSHSFDDSMRIYLNTLEVTNELNTGSFNNNISYVVSGHDGGKICGTPTAALEVPFATLTSRLEREYKFTKTNFSQVFNWDIMIDTCSSLASINPNNIRLLIDLDGDFSDAQSFSNANGLSFVVNGNILSILGISDLHIPNGTTRFATIAYTDVAYSITTSNPICAGETAWVVFNIQNAQSPLQINYTDGTNNYTINNVVDGDTLFLNPTATTTYNFEPLTLLLNCCGNPNALSTTIVVNPLPQISINANETVVCSGESIILTASGANSYSWTHGTANGQSFVPDTSGIYTATGTTTNGCSSSGSIYITVNSNPIITIDNPIFVACEGDEIVYSALGANSYSWNNGITNGVGFIAQAGATTYTVIGTDVNGCVGTTQITLTVDVMPTAIGEASVTTGVAPLVVNFDNFSINATSYFWDFGNGSTSTSSGMVETTYTTGNTYTVYLTAFNGECESTWSEQIDVESGEITIILPNVFTPNGDGQNDYYTIISENVADISGTISNRWGNVIYSFNSPDFQWDGSDAVDGVYFISYNAKAIDGTQKQGQEFIHLQR